VEEVNDTANRLVTSFWPGPLTIVFNTKACVSKLVTCGKNTVAVRQPSHPVAQALIRAARVPIAAPSANKSGRPSPTLAEVKACGAYIRLSFFCFATDQWPSPRPSQHVREDLEGAIAGIVDGGATEDGLESTVLPTPKKHRAFGPLFPNPA